MWSICRANFSCVVAILVVTTPLLTFAQTASPDDAAFFEKRVRPLLVKHCYECHSESAGEQQGGLLLDRASGWLKGGTSGKAVLPGEPDGSLLITAVLYDKEDLQMPPEEKLADNDIQTLVAWVKRGAPGPRDDLPETEFSRLGNQDYLFKKAATHWAFQPVSRSQLPEVPSTTWNRNPIDRLIYARLQSQGLKPSGTASPRVLIRRLSYDLTGLPPTDVEVRDFEQQWKKSPTTATHDLIDRLIETDRFGEHFARMWLDVARYADTDSFYRPDTRTPHYFPFAFTYRDYVIQSFNSDTPVDIFIKEQFAADLMEGEHNPAALGFLTVGPHANRNPTEAVDDWIDITTRGLMGVTAACARCHDHKYEPIPTADYYALHGVFSSLLRVKPLAEDQLPLIDGYSPSPEDVKDYEEKRARIENKIADADAKKGKGNNRSAAKKIKETELAELLLFHPGAPARAMVVKEKKNPVTSAILIRGDATNLGAQIPRRFLKVLDPEQLPFPADSSGRLALAERIASPDNPLTARVFVNRVWGQLMGAYLVDTPSDFGLQGSPPTHPVLLDRLAADFMEAGWSLKSLVRSIALSRTYAQTSDVRNAQAAELDPENVMYWRAHRKHLSIEEIHDSLLAVGGQIDLTPFGRSQPLWGDKFSHRRAIYGYINRFNLDPTLRAFDFPTPMQTQPRRDESIVAPQALFTMNSRFVIEQARALTESDRFRAAERDEDRVRVLFEQILQRPPAPIETVRIVKLAEVQEKQSASRQPDSRLVSTWPMIAQAILMSNEFQYID